MPFRKDDGPFVDDGVYNPRSEVDQKVKAVSPPDNWIAKKINNNSFDRKKLALFKTLSNKWTFKLHYNLDVLVILLS